MSYSQNNEEAHILEFFKDKPVGRLLDIGAFDGRTFSNSLALIEKGWSAVLVEPNPNSMEALIRLHGTNEKVRLVNCAVVPAQYHLMQFWSCNDAVSTLDASFKPGWEGIGVKFNPIWIAPILPSTITQFTGPVDFATIDVEDNNLALAKAMKDFLATVPLVCIEHTAGGVSCESGLKQIFVQELGFDLVHSTGENYIFQKKQ